MGRPSICAGTVLVFVLAGSSVALPARGEIFVLRSGGRIEGQHLNPQRTAGQPYQVRTGEGLSLALAENSVARVVVKSDVQREYDAKLHSVENTVKGHWEIAEWCKEAGLTDERRRHLMAVIGLDPNHAEARRVLGYTLYGSQWLTQSEFLESRGYTFTKGSWKLQQEIELELQGREREAAVKRLRGEIRTALDHISAGNRHAANATRSLNEIRDANAAPALADILADSRQPRNARLICLEILGRLPPGLAMVALINVALNDKDDAIRDRCLDELIRGGAHLAAPVFVRELTSKKNFKIEQNWRVNRAAYCLERLGYKDATLDLIDALVTEHQEIVQQSGGQAGQTSAMFSPTGGAGTFGVGGRPKVKKTKKENAAVHSALTRLYPGVNHQYDIDAWKRWYIEKFTTTNVDLRRDE